MKFCLPKGIPEYVLMEVFYFKLSKDTQHTVGAVFAGGMLKSFYNQIKSMLNSMAGNSQEWDDSDFSSRLVGEEKLKTDWIERQWWHYKNNGYHE